ncbi:MAG: hypothetical protein JEZ09_19595 [Salinivirgaceae bacterium]|nr:hypothetical protein [Salinivirgaceae bacterium]
MSDDSDRGWTWGVSSKTPIAALNTEGTMQINKDFYALGNVGIGTTSPKNPGNFNNVLHLAGKTSASSQLLIGGNTGTNDFVSLGYTSNDFYLRNFAAGNIYFGTSSTAGHPATSMTILSSGNVGIGTTSPQSPLSLGEWASGTAGANGCTQLLISGNHNLGANLGGKKLVIEGYDNDGTEVFPIFVKDENEFVDFYIKNRPSASQLPQMYFAGNIGIGTKNPTAKLTVNGKILAKEIEVVSSIASDFVFEDDYKLRSLEEVENFVKENKHLPEIPSMYEFAEEGQNIGEMQDLLLRKIEELTLYMIELKKENEAIKQQLNN